jgi:hypothetical protein
VHSPRNPASWVKLCPGRRRPPRPMGEITIRHWDLPGRSLEVYATSGNGTRRYLKGCRSKGRSPVGAVAAHFPAKEAGPDLFSRMTAGPVAVNLTGGKRVPFRNWHRRSIAKDFPLPTAAFVNRTLYRSADKSLARPTSRCILFDG